LPHARLLERVAPTVMRASELYHAHRSAEHPGLAALIRFTQRNPASPSLKLPFTKVPDAVATFPMQEYPSPTRQQRKPTHKLPAIEPARRPAAVSGGGGGGALENSIPHPPAAARPVAGGKASGGYARVEAVKNGRTAGINRAGRKGEADGAGAGAPRKPRAGADDDRRRSREEPLKASLGTGGDGKLKPAKPAASAAAEPAKGGYARASKPVARPAVGGKASSSRSGDEPRGRRATRAAGGLKSAGEKALEALEKALNAAEDPNSVEIPAGLVVKVEHRERVLHVVPAQLGLGEAMSAALEILDGIAVKAVGVHILHPMTAEETILRVVPEGAAGKAAQGKKPAGAGTTGSLGARGTRAARASPSPMPASARRETRAKPAPQAKPDGNAKTMPPRPKLVPSDARGRSAQRSSSEPRARPRPLAEPARERKVAAPPPKPPPPKPKPKPVALLSMSDTLGGPAKETLLMRAEVRKQLEEEERIKKERERDARLEKRRKETHAKLLEYQERKQQKEEEKEAKAEAAVLAQKEEERKQREKEKRRQSKNKQKLLEYRKTDPAATLILGEAAPSPAAEPNPPSKSKPADAPASGSAASAPAPAQAASEAEMAAALAPPETEPEARLAPETEAAVITEPAAAEPEPAAANAKPEPTDEATEAGEGAEPGAEKA
jgi:hypothetical protein